VTTYWRPGVYREDVVLAPPAELPTGVPAFLGRAVGGAANRPERLTPGRPFAAVFGATPLGSWLAAAVAGFFANDGEQCFVVPLADGDPEAALDQGLDALATLEEIDLVCVPDLFASFTRASDLDAPLRMQNRVLAHCDAQGDRFAILDPPQGASLDRVGSQRQGLVGGKGGNGALYYPWVKPVGGSDFVPPCGHVAGVYARSDRRIGVHKAPANEILAGVVDLETALTDAEQAVLNPQGINALRAFPGRGIRVWGARTLASDPWLYVNVRRLFLTAVRWIERNLADAAFEPNDPRLWSRISRELNVYFGRLFAAGALKGRTEAEAFYVKCDAETNPPEVREAGQVVTEIGLAPTLPNEFVIVRLIHGAGGVEVAGPTPG